MDLELFCFFYARGTPPEICEEASPEGIWRGLGLLLQFFIFS